MSRPALPDSSPDSAPASAAPATSVRFLVIGSLVAMSVMLYLDRNCVGLAKETIRQDLALTGTEMEWFMGLFYASYALGQVPTGWLSDRFGARWMLAFYILAWSLFTAMFGVTTGFLSLIVARLGCGLSQAGAYPTASSVIGHWVPLGARGTASSLVAMGGRIGGALAPFLTAVLIVACVPKDVSPSLGTADLLDAGQIAARSAPLTGPAGKGETQPTDVGTYIWSLLDPESQEAWARIALESRRVDLLTEGGGKPANEAAPELAVRKYAERDLAAFSSSLNALISGPSIFDETAFRNSNREREAGWMLDRLATGESLSATESGRLNRLLLEAAYPTGVRKLYVHGWRPVMFIYGAAGLLVAGLFWYVYRNRPGEHPGVNAAERALIAAGRSPESGAADGKADAIPLRALATDFSMLCNSGAQIFTNIGWLFSVVSFPDFLTKHHHVSIVDVGFMGSIVLVIGTVGMLVGGPLTDWLVPPLGRKWGRRLPLVATRFVGALAFLGSALLLSFPADSTLGGPWVATMVVGLMCFAQDMGNPALWAYCQDVGGKHGGSVLGWGNMWGNFAAAAAPPLIYAKILKGAPGVGDWRFLFFICAGSFALSGIFALGIDASRPLIVEKPSRLTEETI